MRKTGRAIQTHWAHALVTRVDRRWENPRDGRIRGSPFRMALTGALQLVCLNVCIPSARGSNDLYPTVLLSKPKGGNVLKAFYKL